MKNIDKIIQSLEIINKEEETQQQQQQQQQQRQNLRENSSSNNRTSKNSHDKQKSVVVKKDDHISLLLRRTFDVNVNRRLLGNAPVRKVKFKDPLASVLTLRTVFVELDWAVCNILLKGSNLSRIKRMLHRMSSISYPPLPLSLTSSPSPCFSPTGVNILSRSLIVLNLYFDDLLLGQYGLGVTLASHMHQSGVPESATCSQEAMTFLNRAGKPIYDTLKLLTLNRNRQRTYIDALMVPEWNALKIDAGLADQSFQRGYGLDPATIAPFITNYVLCTTVWLMEHYLSLGVETGLFTTHYDLSTAYWYWDFLLSTQLGIKSSMKKSKVERKTMEERISREVEEMKNKKTTAADTASVSNNYHTSTAVHSRKENTNRGGKRRGKKANKVVRHKLAPPPLWIATSEDKEDDIDLMILGIRQNICRGIVRVSHLCNFRK